MPKREEGYCSFTKRHKCPFKQYPTDFEDNFLILCILGSSAIDHTLFTKMIVWNVDALLAIYIVSRKMYTF